MKKFMGFSEENPESFSTPSAKTNCSHVALSTKAYKKIEILMSRFYSQTSKFLRLNMDSGQFPALGDPQFREGSAQALVPDTGVLTSSTVQAGHKTRKPVIHRSPPGDDHQVVR